MEYPRGGRWRDHGRSEEVQGGEQGVGAREEGGDYWSKSVVVCCLGAHPGGHFWSPVWVEVSSVELGGEEEVEGTEGFDGRVVVVDVDVDVDVRACVRACVR